MCLLTRLKIDLGVHFDTLDVLLTSLEAQHLSYAWHQFVWTVDEYSFRFHECSYVHTCSLKLMRVRVPRSPEVLVVSVSLMKFQQPYFRCQMPICYIGHWHPFMPRLYKWQSIVCSRSDVALNVVWGFWWCSDAKSDPDSDDEWGARCEPLHSTQLHKYKYANTNTQIQIHKYNPDSDDEWGARCGIIYQPILPTPATPLPESRHQWTSALYTITQIQIRKYQQDFGALPYIDLHVSLWYRLQHRLDKNTTIHTVEPLGRSEHTKQRQTGPAGLLTKTYY